MVTTQLVRRAVALVLVSAVVGMTSPANAIWYQGGIEWYVTPDGTNVGDCFGNCGAGCGDSWNICGGPQQYWDMTFIDGPDLMFVSHYEACGPNGYYYADMEHYQAVGTWTYHGWVAPLCQAHDATCNKWLVGCAWVAPCGSPQYADSWSYDEYMQGTRLTNFRIVSEC